MRLSLFALALMFTFCFSELNAQTDVKISKKDFKNDRSGFEAAWQSVTKGDACFKEGGLLYATAFEEYVKATLYNGVNPELNYKTGVSALYSANKEKAAGYFQKVLEEKTGLTEDLLFFTGRALQYAGKYDEAADKYSSFIKTAGKKSEQMVISAKKYLEECKAAGEITKDTLRIAINSLGSGINSNADEYAALLSSDGKTIYFASRRQLSKSSTRFDDSRYDENILYSTRIGDGWGLPVPAGKNLTSKYCETPLFLSPDGEELYIYAGYENGGDIRKSLKKKGEWKKPESVPFNINSSGIETSMTISPSGQEVWFVSGDGKEGFGGKDIYSIKKLNEKKWSKPVNAGPGINTSWDEESIHFSGDGDTLFFSSMGHSTVGGFDIFFSVKDSTGKWSDCVNFGYPVNTSWDELFYFRPDSAGRSFYFASNRPESMGGLDIFSGSILPPVPVIIPEPPKPAPVAIRDTIVIIKEITPPPAPVIQAPVEIIFFLTGKVKDSETGEPVLAKIDIIDLTTDAVIATTASSDVDGTYRIKLPEKKSYMATIRGTGFLSDMKRINIPATFTGETYNLDVSLVKVKVGRKVVLNNILFETGKSVLTAGSSAEIDRLFIILTENPLMKIEVSGHTDKTGSEPVNFKLSEARAKAVVDYLVNKGIVATRMEFRGYGSLQPIADNTTAAGRGKNRRVEFKILEF